MSEVIDAVDVVTTPKRRGPKPGFKMPDNMVSPSQFVKAWENPANVFRSDVVQELKNAGFDYIELPHVIQRERNLRKVGVNLSRKASQRGLGGGRKTDVTALNDLIAQLAGE